jgi:RNA polymerase sigma-70 factor, ECF subfamily
VSNLSGLRAVGDERLSNPTRSEDPVEALTAQLRAGEETAVASFEALYGRVLTGFLRDSLGERGAVEDVRQQVLLEVWRRGPEYDGARASVLTWALMIARSRAADERRRRRPDPIDPADIEAAAVGEAELDHLLDRWRLAGYLERIPADEAAVLRMRFYEGRSQSEIADRSETALGTVKTRMVRGLARLREMIAEEEAS